MDKKSDCKVCLIKKFFHKRAGNFKGDFLEYPKYASLTPPMGWSSWNAFRNNIDENLILQIAKAMKDKGLVQAGYKYLNLDDCWHSSSRDQNGELQGDLVRFPSGIKNLVNKLNRMGIKTGIYSSNGIFTCEDLPASLYNEEKDALTFAKWGIEYLKYDFCHNIPLSQKAPLIYKIDLFDGTVQEYLVEQASLQGAARLVNHKKLKHYVKGLNKGKGALVFKVNSQTDKQSVLTVHIKKKGKYPKFLIAQVNDKRYQMLFPPQKIWNLTYRHQIKIDIKKGENVIKLYNPIKNKIYSAFYQYRKMGEALIDAVNKVYLGKEKKPIVFSICEWGRNKPWLWGKYAGNLWRTTPDIRPIWIWIKYIYNKTIKLSKYSVQGGWNDPDMLEVGNGNLTLEQNKSHFSLWCMMNAPLILGNDLRDISANILKIVTNQNLISINQDSLATAAKRIKKSSVDTLIKPLSDGYALCFFNKTRHSKKRVYDIGKIFEKEDIAFDKDSFFIKDMWTDQKEKYSERLSIELKPYECKVLKTYKN
ncbi:MAG: glycoside hydrolase family 27 protein [Bacillota bacterium]|mgnify:CR=1 FL=1|jgi:hypothetical protein|nr:glycoside hydrolase family 27 protein [Bacillota bacterium]HHU44002.1 glycoside hydrolase family 27 protein [Clostridiales bacterium]